MPQTSVKSLLYQWAHDKTAPSISKEEKHGVEKAFEPWLLVNESRAIVFSTVASINSGDRKYRGWRKAKEKRVLYAATN
jgi:hypothetical protein